MNQTVSCIILLLITLNIWAQNPNVKITKAEHIPIDTTNVMIPSDNPLSDDKIAPEQSTNVDSTYPKSTSEIIKRNPETYLKTLTLPIVNLKDNPDLAKKDSLWMDLVRRHNTYSPEEIQYNSEDDLIATTWAVEELPTELLKSRLETINAKTPFNVQYSPILEALIKRYLKERPKIFSGLMAKAKYYFPLFEEKLDAYDLPLEMKYLAIVESALKPKARSRVGATGLWQFMYQTGKMYGLEVSSYVDERMDPVFATDAAARHLSDLYDIFDDWDLVLAAYNSGAGNVNKAIRRSGGHKNYWNIRPYLPRETASYVPIFYATLYLFEYGHEHNIFPDRSMTLKRYETDSIRIKHNISFEQIEEATGIDNSLLEFLNPSYKLGIIPYEKGKDYYLVLPREYVGVFTQNEQVIYAYVEAQNTKRETPLPQNVKLSNAITYRVRRGDYLGKVASRYGVSVRQIMRWNHLRSNRLRVGQRLRIYSRSRMATAPKTATVKLEKGEIKYYTVRAGDTLWNIAKRFPNVTVSDIKTWNNLTSNNLYVGRKLKIKG